MTVESEAELAKFRLEKEKYNEMLRLMADIKRDSVVSSVKQHHHLPYAANPQFWGRKNALEHIGKALDPSRNRGKLQSFALYGMGGVGKTQIALQFATSSRSKFGTAIWIAADTQITMSQSFRETARNLGLIESNQVIEDNSVTLKVKNWLRETGEDLLLVADRL